MKIIICIVDRIPRKDFFFFFKKNDKINVEEIQAAANIIVQE